jgi:beta-lactamase class A
MHKLKYIWLRNHWHLIKYFISTLVIILGINIFQHIILLPSAASSSIETSQKKLTQPYSPQSLAELYQLRNHLQSEVDRLPRPWSWMRLVNASEYQKQIIQRETLIDKLQTVEAQIKINQMAEVKWNRALNLASLAVKTARSPSQSIDKWWQVKSLWEQALSLLNQIPANSFFKARSLQKIKRYEKDWLTTKQKLADAQTKLLALICKLPRECRHWRGNQPIPKPASLSKIPIAVALLHKIETENISLDTPIYVSTGNLTEDSDVQIQVGKRYPIKTLLREMITHSSNIAGNQLIDYMGWDYINQVLKKRGYRVTRIGSKFIGQTGVPANLAQGGSLITSNELTRMMVEIYNRKHPGDEVLIDILSHQHNHYLGFVALKSTPGQWLGEKTGETSTVQGTTLAFSLAGNTYVVTVINFRGYRDANIRRCLTQLVNYIAQYGYF